MLGIMLSVMLAVTPLGTFGQTYKIKEQDALLEMENKIKQVDTEKIRRELESKYRNFKPEDWKSLPPAKKNFSYHVDMTYTLDKDIPKYNAKGEFEGIIYPKGFQFNPLDYMPADPPPFIIFNGESRKEKQWVKQYYKDKINVMFIITKGSFTKVAEEMGRPVFYLKSLIAEKLNLKNTVSVVYRDGKNMKVDVYAVENNKK